MIEPYQSKAALAAKKAFGQAKKVIEMINRGAYCMDIIQQIRAAHGLLDSAASQVLESHLHTCGKKAFGSRDKAMRNTMIREIITAFQANNK